MRIEHAVDVAVAVFDALDDLRLAHHAAAEKNFLLRMPGLGVHQRADVAVDAGFRVLTDGAGVDNDAVRALFGVHDLIPACTQHPADAFGIRFVLLAAVCIDKGPRRPAARGPKGFDLLADSGFLLQRLLRDHNGFAFHVCFLRTA